MRTASIGLRSPGDPVLARRRRHADRLDTARRAGRRRDRRRRHHRLQCGPHPRAGRDSRPSARGARHRGRGERPERRVRAPRNGSAVDVAVETVGLERATALWRWTEDEIEALKGLAGDTFRQIGSLRLAVETRSVTSSAPSTMPWWPPGSRSSGSTSPTRRSRAGSWRGCSIHPTARSSRRAGAKAGGPRRGRGCGDRRASAGRVRRGARGPGRDSRDGWVSQRSARRDRGTRDPDARSGDRHGADPRALVRDAPLRPPRVRLLAPDAGWAHHRGRLPRRAAGRGVHRGRADDRAGAGGSGEIRHGSWGASSASTTAGRGSSGW